MAVLKVLTDVLLAVDSGDLSVLALLDLSAAFDTVDHHILLAHLRFTFGIDGTALEWLQSLSDWQSRNRPVWLNSVNDHDRLVWHAAGVSSGSAAFYFVHCRLD